jgi:hypothetical protein
MTAEHLLLTEALLGSQISTDSMTMLLCALLQALAARTAYNNVASNMLEAHKAATHTMSTNKDHV